MRVERELILNYAATRIGKELLLRNREIILKENLDWDYLVQETACHGVAPLIYYNLRKGNLLSRLPDKIRSKLEKRYHALAFSNLKLSRELNRLLPIFSKARIEVIVLKGPVLDEAIYPRKGLRPFFDLDILIRREDLPRAENILLGEGYVFPAGILPERFYRQFHFEMPFVNEAKGGIYLEIHWDLLPRWRAHSPEILDVWNRRELSKSQPETYSLSPEDMVIYLCCHMDTHAYMNRYFVSSPEAKDYIFNPSSGNRLIWFSDVNEMVRLFGKRIEWEHLSEKARRWGVETSVYTNLLLTGKLFSRREIIKAVDYFSPPSPGIIKNKLVLLTEKFRLSSRGRKFFGNKMGFRRPLAFTDLIEYLLPDKNAFATKRLPHRRPRDP